MKKILLLTIFLLSFCATSFADNWQWIESTDTLTISVNTEQSYKNNNIYTGWIQIVPVEYARNTYKGKPVAKIILKCSFKTTPTGNMMNIHEVFAYDDRGNFLDSDKYGKGWESITPESGGETMYKAVRDVYNNKNRV